MTGEKIGLIASLRAEALKSRHAAPVRLALVMALPMPLLGAMPYQGYQSFSAWNYWSALFLPVALSLVVACVAQADARTRMRGLLGLGVPLGCAWWAKALWCLALCALSNLVVFGIYLVCSAFTAEGLTAAGALTMLLLRARQHGDHSVDDSRGALAPRRASACSPASSSRSPFSSWAGWPGRRYRCRNSSRRRRAWSYPPRSSPCCRAASRCAADVALGSALAADGTLTMAGLAVCALAFAALTTAGAAWFARSEER